VFWSVFVFVGIEKVRIVPGITASNPFDLAGWLERQRV